MCSAQSASAHGRVLCAHLVGRKRWVCGLFVLHTGPGHVQESIRVDCGARWGRGSAETEAAGRGRVGMGRALGLADTGGRPGRANIAGGEYPAAGVTRLRGVHMLWRDSATLACLGRPGSSRSDLRSLCVMVDKIYFFCPSRDIAYVQARHYTGPKRDCDG